MCHITDTGLTQLSLKHLHGVYGRRGGETLIKASGTLEIISINISSGQSYAPLYSCMIYFRMYTNLSRQTCMPLDLGRKPLVRHAERCGIMIGREYMSTATVSASLEDQADRARRKMLDGKRIGIELSSAVDREKICPPNLGELGSQGGRRNVPRKWQTNG